MSTYHIVESSYIHKSATYFVFILFSYQLFKYNVLLLRKKHYNVKSKYDSLNITAFLLTHLNGIQIAFVPLSLNVPAHICVQALMSRVFIGVSLWALLIESLSTQLIELRL